MTQRLRAEQSGEYWTQWEETAGRWALGASYLILFAKYNGEVNVDEMDKACSMHGDEEECV
jgi:hypothetical protein